MKRANQGNSIERKHGKRYTFLTIRSSSDTEDSEFLTFNETVGYHGYVLVS
jgi:hypothetical protein